MEFRILGPLEILDGERVVPLGGPKRRAVVALLLLHPNRVVASEQLIDGVWGDGPPPSALGSLQNQVLRLRRELGDRLVTRSPGYLLRVERDELDLDRFRRLLEEARAGEPEEAAALLNDALALWRGDPLADLADEPAGAAAAHLAELRLEALENRIDADLALGRHAALVPELEALVAEHPFRERLRAQLLLALYRSGRQADALDAYANARTMLVDELGAEPGAELQTLQRAILRQDSAIAGPEAVAAQVPSGGAEEARKTVTVLLADLAGDQATDPEVRREELRRRRDEAVAALEALGGTAGRTADDRVLGIFGVPLAHDDDALRAVRAACELRASGLVARATVATGDVITGDPAAGQPLVSGPPLEEADRLRAAAEPGDVLVGERAWRLVRHAVIGERRDGGHAVERVLDDAEPVVRRLETPLVGREDELAEIVAAYRRVTRDGRARLVTVFGSPGVGKTRLAREAIEAFSASATCLVGRTPAYGDAPTFAPLRDAFSALAGGSITSWAGAILAGERDGIAVAATIAAAAGEAASTGPVEETAWATRRLLETVARSRPVVLVLEDLHWASPAFLDLVDHVAEFAHGPMLLLALARPDLLDTRPEWAGGRLNASTILLEPLPQGQAETLLDRLAADAPLAGERRSAILESAAGNPLFLEQLLASTLEGGEPAVPDSIHALLAARLDLLRDDDREVAQAAAVCGQRFAADVLQSLIGADPRPALRALARRDFVEPESPGAFGEETWAFRHALVRDEAYEGIPKRRRALLHRQLADIVAERAASGNIDADELVGYHLESAFRATLDVDPQAPGLAGLAAEASARLASAGRRAYDERDATTSAGLLKRAAELLPPGAPERLSYAPMLADALALTGERAAAGRVLDDAEAARPDDDAHTRARLVVARHGLRLWGLETEDTERTLAETELAIAVLEAAGDEEGLAHAHIVRAQASERRAAVTGLPEVDVQEELRRAVAHARAAGSRQFEGVAASWLCLIARRGPWPVDEAKRLVQGVRDDPPNRYALASALGGLADLRAMDGAFDEARALAAENHAILEDLGLPQTAAADLILLADIEILAGDPDAAERILRDAVSRLDELGDRFSAAHAVWRLALVLIRRGDDDGATAFVKRTAEADAGEFVRAWSFVLEAMLDARGGRGHRVQDLVDEADRTFGESRALTGIHADMLLQAAEASAIAGRTADAVARLRRAADIAAQLGYVVAERVARERLTALGG